MINPLEPVIGSDGKMITAVIPQVTLPKPTVPKPTAPQSEQYPGFVPDPDPYPGFVPDFQSPTAPVSTDLYPGFVPDASTLLAPAVPAAVSAPPDSFMGDVKLAGKVIGTGLYSAVADVLPKTIAETWMGGNLKVSDAMSAIARYRNVQIEDLKRWNLTPAEEENALFGIIKAKNVLSGLQNLGYSGATMLAGYFLGSKLGAPVGGAIGTAIAPGPGTVAGGAVGRVAGGVLGVGAATSAVAYRATKTQFVSDMRDKFLSTKPNATEEEWGEFRKTIENDAQIYAMWEAVPEVVGNMLTAGIIKTPVGKFIKNIPLIKNAIARTLADAGVKLGLNIPVEVGTETVTQFGQETVQHRQGLQEEAPTWKGAFQSVFAQTMVTTLATLGFGSIVNQMSRPAPDIAVKDVDTTKDYHARLKSIGLTDAQIGNFDQQLALAKTPEEMQGVIERIIAQFSNVIKPPAEAPTAPAMPEPGVAPAEAVAPMPAPAIEPIEPILPPPAPPTPVRAEIPAPVTAGVMETQIPLEARAGAVVTPEGRIIGKPELIYRGFDSPSEAIGPDRSYQRGRPFQWGGVYELEAIQVKGIPIGPEKPGAGRGSIGPKSVTRILIDEKGWGSDVRDQRLSEDLPELRRMFPNVELVRVKLEEDAEHRSAVPWGDWNKYLTPRAIEPIAKPAVPELMTPNAAKKLGYNIGPVWHGTLSPKFDVFKTPSWFSTSEKYAKTYLKEGRSFARGTSPRTEKVYLHLVNPMDWRQFSVEKNKNLRQIKNHFLKLGFDEKFIEDNVFPNYPDTHSSGHAGLFGPGADNPKVLIDEARRLGYDGIVAKEARNDVQMVFDPSQIKLIEPKPVAPEGIGVEEYLQNDPRVQKARIAVENAKANTPWNIEVAEEELARAEANARALYRTKQELVRTEVRPAEPLEVVEPETPEAELNHGDLVDLPEGEGTVVGKTPEGNAWVLVHETNKIVDSGEPFTGEVPAGLEGDIDAIQKSIAEGVDVRQPPGYGEAVGRAHPEGEIPAEARPGEAAPEIVVEGKPDIQQGGKDTRVYGTRADVFPAKYAIVPREALVASHDPVTFAKNPLYPLVNPRDYSSPGEQAKVIDIRNKFAPDQHITDATSAAVGPVMAAHVTDNQGNRRLIVLGGNTREMVTQSITAAQKEALADFTNERTAQFGVKALPNAEHELIRYMGEFDLRQPGVREKLQSIVDSLNPSPGRVQNLMEITAVDASTTVKPEHLADITADITPEVAQAKVEELIRDGVLDSMTRGSIADHPAQAQEYMRRVLVNVAFQNPVLAEFASMADRKKAAGRGLVESAAPTVVELRRKKQNGIADAIGRTMAEVAGYMNKDNSLQVALQKAAQQIDFDKRYAVVQDIAAVMRDRIALGKKGAINTDETINNFISFWDRVGLAVEEWEKMPEMFGQHRTMNDVIRGILDQIKAEQMAVQSHQNKEAIIAPKTKRESRRKVKLMEAPLLFPEKEMPFGLVGEKMPVVEVAPADKLTQPELFVIQQIIQESDLEKSVNAAERLYGNSQSALRILKKQLAIIDSDPGQRRDFPKDARVRLQDVFGLLEQRIRELPAVTEEAPSPVKAATAQSVVNQYTRNWKNKPEGGITVIQSEEDADALNLSDDSRQAISDYKAEGFYHLPTDTVVIIADNLERTSDAIRVGLHEAIVHSGLRHVLGERFNAELERIGKDIPENELTDVALRYDLDLSNAEERLEIYEEYLGKYSETRHPTLYQRFVVAIRRALRAMGINEHLIDVFDRRGAIDQLVDMGREYMERGRRVEPMPGREGIRMALPTRVPEGTAREDIDRSRFAPRLLLAYEFTPEDRAALKAYAEYKIQHNKETRAEVDAILAKNGAGGAEEMFWRDDKSIIPAARIPLGDALICLHEMAANATKNANERFAHQNAMNDIGEKMIRMGTESGQVSQSYAMVCHGKIIAMPGGAPIVFNRLIRTQIQNEIEKLPAPITEIVQAAKKADVEAIGEAMVEKRVEERIGEILQRLGTTARNGMPTRLRNADNQTKLKTFFASAEYQEKTAEDFKFAIAALSIDEKIERATSFGSKLISDSKTLNYGDWSAKMKARYGEGIEPFLQRIWNESAILLDNVMRGKVQRLAAAAKKTEPGKKKAERPAFTITAEMKKIASDWLAQPPARPTIGEATQQELDKAQQPTLPIQKTVITRLAELGMSERDAFKYVSIVQQEVVNRARIKKEVWLKRFLAGKPISSESHEAVERIMDVSALRRLDEPAIMDILAEKLGLPKLTPEIAGKMQKMAEEIRAAPYGFQKLEAGRKLMTFMKKQFPLHRADVSWSIWYANMLSGYQTQERNVISTFNNVIANLTTSMITDPKNAPFALVGFVHGIKRGWREARYELKTGEVPVHITPEMKLESPSILETNPFRGWAKIFNNWKYVMRAMIAEDMVMFKPAQDVRAMMLAADLAREEGLSGHALWARVAEIMGTTGEQLARFELQAKAEGLTGIRLQHRVDELMEQQRPEQLQAESIDYAKRATFNYQPEGFAGLLGEKIRALYPAGAPGVVVHGIVPFTRIVANVTNTSLDYSPWGFARVKWGIRQAGGKMRMITGHERAQRQAKAFLGTTLMVAAYALDALNDDEDEEKKFFAIYGRGSGESRKDNQLRELGWKPWSVKIGKYYFDYRLTPLAIPFGIIGTIRDAQRWRKLDEKSIWTRASFSILKSLSVVMDMSFVSGIAQFMDLLNPDSPEKSARNIRSFLARTTVGAAVPNIFKQLDRTFDPVLRDNSTFIEAMMREIPIASHLNKPKLNVLGEPIPQTTGPVSLVISPARSSPIFKLIVKNEAWISVPPKTQYIGEHRLTEGEYYRFIQYRGKELRERIEKYMPMLEKLGKERFNDKIDKYTARAARNAKRKIRQERGYR